MEKLILAMHARLDEIRAEKGPLGVPPRGTDRDDSESQNVY